MYTVHVQNCAACNVRRFSYNSGNTTMNEHPVFFLLLLAFTHLTLGNTTFYIIAHQDAEDDFCTEGTIFFNNGFHNSFMFLKSISRARVLTRGNYLNSLNVKALLTYSTDCSQKIAHAIHSRFQWATPLFVKNTDDILLRFNEAVHDLSIKYVGIGNVKGTIIGNELSALFPQGQKQNHLMKKRFSTPKHGKYVAFIEGDEWFHQNTSFDGRSASLTEVVACITRQTCSAFAVVKNNEAFPSDARFRIRQSFACDDITLNEYHELVYQSIDGPRLCPALVGTHARYVNCTWYESFVSQFHIGGSHRDVLNTAAKTWKKWNKEHLGTERWQERKVMAQNVAISQPDLFDRHEISCNVSTAGKKDIIFGIYNYADATSLYRWIRSLREGGGTSDVIIFTHKAHEGLKKVCQRYYCIALEYFSSLTNNLEVDEILKRPHMQALKREFKTELIKNYKFTFMYCYLLEFGQQYRRAAFMDVRDIYFQGDPFSKSLCKGLTTFTETSALLVENREYIYKDHYPKHCDTHWHKFRKLPPLNSGGFIADVETMKKIVKLSDDILVRCGPGFDQGTFTEIVYLKMLPIDVLVYTTEYSPVGMICNSLTVGVNAIDEVINDANETYDVVHQFDRFASLVEIYERAFPLDKDKFDTTLKSFI